MNNTKTTVLPALADADEFGRKNPTGWRRVLKAFGLALWSDLEEERRRYDVLVEDQELSGKLLKQAYKMADESTDAFNATAEAREAELSTVRRLSYHYVQ